MAGVRKHETIRPQRACQQDRPSLLCTRTIVRSRPFTGNTFSERLSVPPTLGWYILICGSPTGHGSYGCLCPSVRTGKIVSWRKSHLPLSSIGRVLPRGLVVCFSRETGAPSSLAATVLEFLEIRLPTTNKVLAAPHDPSWQTSGGQGGGDRRFGCCCSAAAGLRHGRLPCQRGCEIGGLPGRD